MVVAHTKKIVISNYKTLYDRVNSNFSCFGWYFSNWSLCECNSSQRSTTDAVQSERVNAILEKASSRSCVKRRINQLDVNIWQRRTIRDELHGVEHKFKFRTFTIVRDDGTVSNWSWGCLCMEIGNYLLLIRRLRRLTDRCPDYAGMKQ